MKHLVPSDIYTVILREFDFKQEVASELSGKSQQPFPSSAGKRGSHSLSSWKLETPRLFCFGSKYQDGLGTEEEKWNCWKPSSTFCKSEAPKFPASPLITVFIMPSLFNQLFAPVQGIQGGKAPSCSLGASQFIGSDTQVSLRAESTGLNHKATGPYIHKYTDNTLIRHKYTDNYQKLKIRAQFWLAPRWPHPSRCFSFPTSWFFHLPTPCGNDQELVLKQE